MTTAPLLIGARWDDGSQNPRLAAARRAGLIDYVEANYPVGANESPELPDTPVFVHCPANPTASPHGFNRRLAALVRDAAERYDSPWIGEHLCWLGAEAEGRVGYIVNAIADHDTADVAVENLLELRGYYGRPIALELGPHYNSFGDYASELHFLADVAQRADCRVLLDLAHWTASNRNLRRPADYGLDALAPERVIELHIAGLRSGRSSSFWHDAHDLLPDEGLLELCVSMVKRFPALRAVTFEHHPQAPEQDFFQFLGALRGALT